MNRWEKRQKARRGGGGELDMGKVFVSQRGSPDRFSSIHNALTAKNVSCFLISLLVVKLFQRPVSVVSRGTVSIFCINPANINLQKYPGGDRRATIDSHER